MGRGGEGRGGKGEGEGREGEGREGKEEGRARREERGGEGREGRGGEGREGGGEAKVGSYHLCCFTDAQLVTLRLQFTSGFQP